VLHLSDGPALLIRRSSANESYAVVGGPRYLQALFEGVVPAGSAVAATDLEGNAVFGSSSVLRAGIVRTAASTKLPWNLHVSPSEPGDPGNSPRRTLLVSVLSVLAIILITGTYLILRAISREIRVARLQSDFVAAVSHEFRTPLSSLSQISEMLLGDRIPTEALRQKSYEILDRETRRLRTLVEGLLDFGRLEAGGAAYQFENIDAGELTRSVANEFQECVGPDGHVVELSLADKPAYIRADRDALHRALWNLLDNAAKYSPDCRAIRMEVAVTGERVTIAVCDRGVGVPLHEQQAIFSKFVRGAEPKARRIRGTGLGLAIVRHIAEAHGGTVRVASRPGEGSRFTLVLEAAEGGAR
jgi:two-component system phosphate regulon sensor histidine kinase PhoR